MLKFHSRAVEGPKATKCVLYYAYSYLLVVVVVVKEGTEINVSRGGGGIGGKGREGDRL